MKGLPSSTYRLQFNLSFDFQDAKDIILYLENLGISHIYASPIFKSKKGTRHGYDIVDPNQIDMELGSGDELVEILGLLGKRKMGWIQDFPPNHMAYDYENEMLIDTLENGEFSKYFGFFDIDWSHPSKSLNGRVLAPFLGEFYAESLEDGEIQLAYGEGRLYFQYKDLKFPVRIETYSGILSKSLEELEDEFRKNDTAFKKYKKIINALDSLSKDTEKRGGQVESVKSMFRELYEDNEKIRDFIDRRIESINENISLLDDLLSKQLYLLSYWKLANEQINYRRFFTINDLISVRTEKKEVFTHNHSLLFQLLEIENFDGLRIDHIDGLHDPTGYLQDLKEKTSDAFIVVEKILEQGEELPSWPIEGTTGYRVLNYINGVFCKRQNEEEFDKIFSDFTKVEKSYGDLLYEKKKLIIEKYLTGDLDNLARFLDEVSSQDKHGKDISIHGLMESIKETAANFPVYRTYANKDDYREEDRQRIRRGIRKAKSRNPDLSYELNYLKDVLLLNTDSESSKNKKQHLDFLMRFQRFTSSLMAKGFEDTFLYVYNKLLALNEVGGFPKKFGITLDEFHNFNKKRLNEWPSSLNATSTHDTKRGEDVRARLNVLSEIPQEWWKKVAKWNEINENKKKTINGKKVPDKNEEYFLYQTLVGTYPFDDEKISTFIERIKNYIRKSVREAKTHSSWTNPNEKYEDAFISFFEKIMDTNEKNEFLEEFLPFQKKIAHYGIFNSLSQTLLKLTIPGIPDFYRGTELWDLNLVDPDNRRPVNFEKRKKYLDDIHTKAKEDLSSLMEELLANKKDGRIKLFLISRVLNARRKNSKVFQKGAYKPLEKRGKHRDKVIAFTRKLNKKWVITIVPRFLTPLIKEGDPLGNKVWKNTRILIPDAASSSWRDAITEKNIEANEMFFVGKVLEKFPVAMLVGE